MDKYALGWKQLSNRTEAKEAKEDGLRILDIILIVVTIAVVVFYIGLQIGTSIGVDIGREKTISEVLDILKKGQERQGFMPLPSPMMDETKKEIRI